MSKTICETKDCGKPATKTVDYFTDYGGDAVDTCDDCLQATVDFLKEDLKRIHKGDYSDDWIRVLPTREVLINAIAEFIESSGMMVDQAIIVLQNTKDDTTVSKVFN